MSISAQLRTHMGAAMAHPGVAKEVRELLAVTSGNVANATFTIGAEASDAIIVTMQLKDESGDNVTARKAVDVLLLNNGQTDFNSNDYTIAAGTNGKLQQVIADKILRCYTNATGAIDISLTISGAAVTVLAAVMPGGRLAVSNSVVHV